MAFLNHQQHPLQNEVILDTLLKHLTDLDDIKNARLVCSTWRTASLKTWRERGVLVVIQKQEEGERATNNDNRTPPPKYLTQSELLELMKDDKGNGLQLDKKPFQRIKLKNFAFPEDEFMERVGGGGGGGGGDASASSAIKELHLEGCQFPIFSDLQGLLTVRRLPNLEKVVWSKSTFGNMGQIIDEEEEDEDDDDEDDRDGIIEKMKKDHNNIANALRPGGSLQLQQTSLKILQVTRHEDSYEHLLSSVKLTQFLYISPNLEEIIVRQTASDRYYRPHPSRMILEKRNFLEGILAVRSIDPAKPDKLQSLDMMDFFEKTNLEFDWKPIYNLVIRLPLQRFTLDVGTATSEGTASKLLSAFAGTLQVLHAFRVPFLKDHYKGVPFSVEMSALTELRLWGGFTSNLEFLRYTPHLQTLVLKRDCWDKRHKLGFLLTGSRQYVPMQFNEDVVGSTVKLLNKNKRNRNRIPRRGLLTTLTVEGLKHLDIDYNVGAENIPTLASWLPNVTTLKMVLRKKEELEAVSRGWPQLTELECLFGSRVDDDGVVCLLQMSVLKKFKSNAYCGQGLFSSSSADRVFLKMPALEHLDICVSSEMSVKSEEELRGKICHVRLIRNYDDAGGNERHRRHECCDRVGFRRFIK